MTTRAAIAAALVRGGRPPDTPVAVIARGTTASQRVARTTLAGLGDVDLGPPAVIVVGPVAALGMHGAAGPLAGRAVVVTRAGACPRPGGRARAGRRNRDRVPADPSGRRGGRGSRAAAAAAAVQDSAWLVVTSVNAVDRFMAALRDARRSVAFRWLRWVRPPPTRCAGRASSPTSCRPSTVRVGSSRRSPERRPVARRRVLFPPPTWRSALSPRGFAEGLGCAARGGIPHGREPRPGRRCCTGCGRRRADLHGSVDRAGVPGAAQCHRRAGDSAGARRVHRAHHGRGGTGRRAGRRARGVVPRTRASSTR